MAYYGGGGPARLRQALLPSVSPGRYYEELMARKPGTTPLARVQGPALPDPGDPAGYALADYQDLFRNQGNPIAPSGSPDDPSVSSLPELTGVQRFMARLVGQRPRTEADLERLEAAKRMGMLTSGLSLIGSIGGTRRPDIPGNAGTFGRNLADALQAGLGMARSHYSASAPAVPEYIQGPGGALYAQNPDGTLQLAVPGEAPDPTLVKGPHGGTSILEDDGTLREVIPGDPRSERQRNLLWWDSLPEDTEKQRAFKDAVHEQLSRSSAGVTIDIGDKAADAAGREMGISTVQWLAASRAGATNAIDLLQAVGKAHDLLDIIPDKAFRAGGKATQWIDQNVAPSDEKDRYLAAAAEFQTQVAQVVLALLDAFPGQISNEERAFVEEIAGMNFTEAPEQIRGRLDALASKFRAPIDEYLMLTENIDPEAYGISSVQIRPHIAYSERLREILGAVDESAAGRLLARGEIN